MLRLRPLPAFRGTIFANFPLFLLASACGFDSLPPLDEADEPGSGPEFGVRYVPGDGDGDIIVGAGGASNPEVSAGGQPAGGYYSTGGHLVGAGGQYAGAYEPVIPLEPVCAGDCPSYVGVFQECVQDARGYVFCVGGGDGGFYPFCFHGHDGYGNCYPEGCTVDPIYDGAQCAPGADYCSALEAGEAPGELAACPDDGQPGDGTGISACERAYTQCFDTALDQCADVDVCGAAIGECDVAFDACMDDSATCEGDVSSCFASAEECISKFGQVPLCQDYYSFCIDIAEGCVDFE